MHGNTAAGAQFKQQNNRLEETMLIYYRLSRELGIA